MLLLLAAYGYGPILLFGTPKYVKACEVSRCNNQDLIEVKVHDPKAPGTPTIEQVKCKALRHGKLATPDLFPHPPPVECTWNHVAKYYEITRPQICEEICMFWSEMKEIPMHLKRLNGFVAEPQVIVLWMFQEHSQ